MVGYKYAYGHINWEEGTFNPIRLMVGVGKGELVQQMGMSEDHSNSIDEIVRVRRVDTFRLPKEMNEPEFQEWLGENEDELPKRVQERLRICKHEVGEDFDPDDF